MTRLFSTNPMLTRLNQNSFNSPNVHVINADAFPWLDQHDDLFDFVVVDFPDPNNYSLGKLYTTAFYRLLAKHLTAEGLATVQSTSPLFARESYWCIAESLKQAGLRTLSLSRVCARLRRVGVRARGPRDLSPTHPIAVGPPILILTQSPGDVRVSQ